MKNDTQRLEYFRDEKNWETVVEKNFFRFKKLKDYPLARIEIRHKSEYIDDFFEAGVYKVNDDMTVHWTESIAVLKAVKIMRNHDLGREGY